MKMLKKLAERTPEEWAESDRQLREQLATTERERKEKAEAAAIAALHIPDRILRLIRGDLAKTEAVNALVSASVITCLSGNPGTGKTVAAARWLLDGRMGLFVKSAELARWDRYDRGEMARLLRQFRLVVDDLGTEYQDAKGNFMAILDELVDYRYDHDLPLVLTTNLDAEAFKARYGERIADRIRESGDFISLSGSSLRTRVA